MAMTVAAEVVASLWGVRLTASGATGDVDWYRDDEGGDQILVGTGEEIIDRTCGLNIPLVYTAVDDTASVNTGIVRVDSDHPVLGNGLIPVARQVQVVSYRPLSWEATSTYHRVLGSRKPFVTAAPAIDPSGTLVLRARDRAERYLLVGMLTAGDPLLLRTTEPDRLDTLTFVMTNLSDPFVRETMREGETRLQVEFQAVAAIRDQVVPASWTYEALKSSWPDYRAVEAAYADYVSLLAGV